MNRFFIVIIWVVLSPLAWSVDVRTNIAKVYHDGCCERIGSFSLAVSEDAFANASPAHPVYVRFRILRARGWACTLVDQRPNSPSSADVPINLTLHLDGDMALNPALPANAVQLVRFIEGERDAWLKVNISSGAWITDGVTLLPPDYHNTVTLSVGLGAYASVRPDGSTPTQGNEYADGSGLASTAMYANYTNTPDFNPGDLDVLDFISFHDDTVGVETGDHVVPGTNAGVTFSNDNQIARGELHVARFEFHLQQDDFDSPPNVVALNRLNSIDVWNWCGEIPPIYFTNSGDFEWQPGTVVTLCSTDTDAFGASQASGKNGPATFLSEESAVSVVSDGSSSWSVVKVYDDDVFWGFEFHLDSGSLKADETIGVDGLAGCMENDLNSVSLNLMAYAYIFHELITDGELFPLGPRIRQVVTFERAENTYYRQVIPFTAYDRESWEYETFMVNNGTRDGFVTTVLFNRHGIALRVDGMQPLPTHGQHRLSVPETFGNEAKSVLSWMEILCDQPFSCVGLVHDDQDRVLDAFQGVASFDQTLFAVHVPSLPEVWKTAAYVLSSDLDVDTQFYLQVADQMPNQIRSILIPGATAVLDDDDFGWQEDRLEWFQVNATHPAGSGLILYSKTLGSGQLASVSMNLEPSPTWTFDHLGNPQAGWWTGLVVVNPEGAPVELRIASFTADHELVSERPLSVEAYGKTVVTEGFFVAKTDPVVSRLEIGADGPILALLLTGLDDQDMLTRISGNLQPGTQLTLPYLPQSAEDWVGVAVVNPGANAASATLTLYTRNGEAGPSAMMSLPPQGKELFLLSELIGDFAGYSHAVLTSNIPVRGMALLGNHSHTKLATINLTP